MKGTLAQHQTLSQLQRLTPMQVQFVRMLEMTGPELEHEVERQLEEMPALERADATATTGETSDEDTFQESAEDLQMADYAREEEIPSYRLNTQAAPADNDFIPQTSDSGETLMELLERQLPELNLNDHDRTLAQYIIGNIDGNGYLRRPAEAIAYDIAVSTGEDISQDHIELLLNKIRTLDPAGVAATDLRQCLLLQLERMEPTKPIADATTIIRDYFDLFAKRHFDRIAAAANMTEHQIQEAVRVITRLNPKPGNVADESDFEHRSRQIVPEIELNIIDDKLTLSLLDNIPELTIAETFTKDPDTKGVTSQRARNEAATFIRSRREEAATFIKVLKLRQQILFNVAKAIVDFQRDFFLTGDKTALKPMGLKDIAAATGYDLSAVSRATATKYILCPTGIYPLKFFFNEKSASADGTDNATYHTISEAIRRLVEAEDKSAPLSDDSLTSLLSAQGFNIARRTVSKYRERLGYPIARLRRGISDNTKKNDSA